MGLGKSIKKGISKLFGGGHSSGPTVVAPPEAQMQTVQQDAAVTAQKRQQGMLSTLLGGQRSFAMDKSTTNAYAFSGNEYANNKAEYLATNTVKERDYRKEALRGLSIVGGGAGLGSKLGSAFAGGTAGMLLGAGVGYASIEAIDKLAHGAISKTLNSAIKDVKNIGAKLGIGHRHKTQVDLEKIRQDTANAIDNTTTGATQFSDDTQGTSKKYKKQSTSEFLGM